MYVCVLHVYIYICGYGNMHVTEHVWRLEDNFWKLFLIFDLVEARLVSAAMMQTHSTLWPMSF